MPQSIASWDEFSNTFIRQFIVDVDATQILRSFTTISQNSGESIKDFTTQFLKIKESILASYTQNYVTCCIYYYNGLFVDYKFKIK